MNHFGETATGSIKSGDQEKYFEKNLAIISSIPSLMFIGFYCTFETTIYSFSSIWPNPDSRAFLKSSFIIFLQAKTRKRLISPAEPHYFTLSFYKKKTKFQLIFFFFF